MHEVGIAKEVLNISLGRAAGKKIKSITVELADDGHTTAATFTSAFTMVSQGTVAEGAVLKIRNSDELESRVLELEVEQ
ncbi:MAG: hypothetical protein COS94_10775 [Candidatus Hydrogenedentes bacterium CG07_land_8_20_14_0_80_42_17]|nr:MAG: hypothetical protein COS94_10775 [Candidatus Hydrogenedentes bacterium CG07_land_8_20_14_0_80_42_17]